uniref:MARVEL domain-containing protein n=1 Tax=Angiostrongylus cantonensis TaxID=6313 RepID=A0A0K0CY05_ANGCA
MVACARVPPATVLLALVTTTLSCSAIILFASQTSFDVTRHMFIIFAAGTAVAIFGVVLMILSLFVYIKVLHTVFTALVCVSFMAYLAVDIQMIVGGRRYNLSPEEYVFASLLLFIDIYEIFLTLLSLFNRE